jgi:hypothetical protein
MMRLFPRMLMACSALAMLPASAFAQVNPTPSFANTGGQTTTPKTTSVLLGVLGGAAPVGSGIAPNYIGEVATRTQVPNVDGAQNPGQILARTFHYARQTLTTLSVVFPDFWVLHGNGEMPGSTGNMTIHASVEWPVGTFTMLPCHGVQGCIATSGGMVQTDFVKLPTLIPNGAKFYIWEWSSSVGSPYNQFVQPQTQAAANGEYLQVGTTEPDLTLTGGTLTQSISGRYIFPVAIVAPTMRAAGCLIGDSRLMGYQDQQNDASGSVGTVERGLDQQFPTINMGIPSDTASSIGIGSWVNREALGHFCSFGVDTNGANDISSNAVPATIAANRTLIAQGFPGLTMYGVTIEGEPTSTDSWATTANQTAMANEANRITFNALVRAGIPGEVDYFDLAHMIDPTDSGKWPVTGAAFGCTPDGVHENTLTATLAEQGTACGVFMNPFRNIDASLR